MEAAPVRSNALGCAEVRRNLERTWAAVRRYNGLPNPPPGVKLSTVSAFCEYFGLRGWLAVRPVSVALGSARAYGPWGRFWPYFWANVTCKTCGGSASTFWGLGGALLRTFAWAALRCANSPCLVVEMPRAILIGHCFLSFHGCRPLQKRRRAVLGLVAQKFGPESLDENMHLGRAWLNSS